MKILTGIATLPDSESSVVTVGNFDGVHCGHQKLLAEVMIRARDSGRKSVAITFEPHTRMVVGGGDSYNLLTSIEEKSALFEVLGLDYLYIIPFDQAMREKSPEMFVEEILVQKLHMAEWVLGQGHGFGKNRSGSDIFLREMRGKYHFVTFVADLLTRNGTTISSTQVRENIAQGRIAEAVEMLGHPYLIAVERTRGIQLGTKLGYPTLNFRKPPSRKVIPPPGVYAAELEFKGTREPGALYFGECPTLHDQHRDVHFEFFSFERGKEEIAEGDNAQLWLYSFIRKDQAFDGTGALVEQITKDVETTKTFFMKEKWQWR